MRSHLNVPWSQATPDASGMSNHATAAARIQAFADQSLGSARSSASGKPMLVFVRSQERRDTKARDARTPQAKVSDALQARVFSGGADIRLAIISRLFQCVSLDVTQVAKTDHPELCSANAPMVMLLDPQGKVFEVIPAMRVTETYLIQRMVALLRHSGCQGVDVRLTEHMKLMDQLKMVETNLSVARENLSKIEADLQKAASKQSARAARNPGASPPSTSGMAQKKVDDARAAVATLEAERAAIMEKEKSLIAESMSALAAAKSAAPT